MNWVLDRHGEAHPRWGIEFDWLGVDNVGHVGQFSSAGYGQVPASVMGIGDQLDELYGRLRDLPVVGGCAERPNRAGDYSDWVCMADRGLYGYDWKIWDGPYERLTVPSRPLTIGHLPKDMAEAARLVRLDIDLAEAKLIDLEAVGVAVARG